MSNQIERDCRNCKYYAETVVFREAACLYWDSPISSLRDSRANIRLLPCENFTLTENEAAYFRGDAEVRP